MTVQNCKHTEKKPRKPKRPPRTPLNEVQWLPDLSDLSVAKSLYDKLTQLRTWFAESDYLSISATKLEAAIGQVNKKTPAFVRDAFLVKVAPAVIGHCPIMYGVNRKALELWWVKVNEALGYEVDLALLDISVSEEHLREIATGCFTYRHEAEAGRLTHPIQNIRREPKKRLFARYGYTHDIDFQACQPTFLLQYCLNHGADPRELAGLIWFVEDPKARRQELVEAARFTNELQREALKDLINALPNGADTHYYKDLVTFDMGYRCTSNLNEHVGFRALVEAFNYVRKFLQPVLAEGGYETVAAFYQANERVFLNIMREHMTKLGARHFCEHDGMKVDREVDLRAIEQLIKDRTGYRLVLVSKPLVVPPLDLPPVPAKSWRGPRDIWRCKHEQVSLMRQATDHNKLLGYAAYEGSFYEPDARTHVPAENFYAN